jgi:hypothetical protein
MIFRDHLLVTLLLCISSCFLNTAYAEAGRIKGKVTETMNASGYTYAEVNTGKNKVWVAAPVAPIKVGDQIEFSTVMPMKNFRSKSLKRDFSVIYFAPDFVTDKEAAKHSKSKQKVAAVVKNIAKVKDGNTIAEVYTEKNKLAGKIIRVRGQVTKFTANILKKNWLHIKDGSTEDLTITTNNRVEVGDIVIISGKLELNKDFGYGYLYPVIVEDAKVTKE